MYFCINIIVKNQARNVNTASRKSDIKYVDQYIKLGLKPIINVYVNDENIKFLEDLQTTLKDKDEILFLPAVSGG